MTFFDFTEFLLRHRLEEALVDVDQALKRSGLALRLLLSLHRGHFHHGFVAARDDDLLAALGAFDQLGEICLGLVNGIDRHGSRSLAKEVS